MNEFLFYPGIKRPESFDKWYSEIREEYDDENVAYWDPEARHFNSISEIYQYYSEFIPKDIWFEFSLFLAEVIDYYIETQEPMEGYVL